MKDLEDIKNEITFKKSIVTKTDRRNLEKNQHIRKWFNNIDSPETRKTYTSLMIHFLREVHLEVNDLITLKRATDKAKGYYPMEELIDEWKERAKKHGVKTHKRRNTITALESFFKWNRLRLEVIKKPSYSAEAREEIKKEDLRKFRDAIGNIRNVALFDWLTCVPLRIGMFKPCNCGDCKIYWYPRWGDIQDFPKIEYGGVIKIEAKKGHTSEAYKEQGHTLHYIGYLNESAKNSLSMYKKLLEEEHLKRPVTKEDPIFLTWRENGEPRTAIKSGEVNRIFEHASKVSGLKFTVHDLRNFVNSTLERHGVIKRFRDINSAHKVSDLARAYSSHSIESMWKGTEESVGFQKVLPYLDVGDSHYKLTMLHDERIAKLEEEKEKLRKEIEEMKSRQEALKRVAKTTPVDYETAKALLGLLQDPDRLGNLRIALQDKVFKEDMQKLAKKRKEAKERDTT